MPQRKRRGFEHEAIAERGLRCARPGGNPDLLNFACELVRKRCSARKRTPGLAAPRRRGSGIDVATGKDNGGSDQYAKRHAVRHVYATRPEAASEARVLTERAQHGPCYLDGRRKRP